jgi:hypothetical protein
MNLFFDERSGYCRSLPIYLTVILVRSLSVSRLNVAISHKSHGTETVTGMEGGAEVELRVNEWERHSAVF